MKRAARWGLVALWVFCAWPTAARAQIVPERELEIAKALFDAGNYKDALKRARDAMAVANFSDEQRIELHRIAGLSAFNQGDAEGAQRHFLQLLQLNPDFVVDPFAAPPSAIKMFEQVRREHADALNLVRQQIALRAQQDKRAAEERERLRVEQEAQRRKIEELTRSTTVRVVEKRALLVNFVPFGAGQFQQGRVEWGIAFAVLEAVTALTSLISYFAIEGLFVEDAFTLHNVLTSDGTGSYQVKFRHIPTSAAAQASVWRTLKVSTGIAFYALWAGGVVDALVHHRAEVTTEHQETISPAPAATPGPKLNIFPTPGGMGAGFTVSF